MAGGQGVLIRGCASGARLVVRKGAGRRHFVCFLFGFLDSSGAVEADQNHLGCGYAANCGDLRDCELVLGAIAARV